MMRYIAKRILHHQIISLFNPHTLPPRSDKVGGIIVIIRKVKTVDWLEDSYPDDRDKPPVRAPGAPPQSGAPTLGGALTSAATPAE